MKSKGLEDLNREVQAIWNQNAAFWDNHIGGEGNDFHRILVGPVVERLMKLQPGELVLEIACGNGQFARRMAQLGVKVIASDFSEKFIEIASERTTEHREQIEYTVIDATDADQLLTLGKRRFDAAVCNMGVMGMATIEPMAFALSQLLKREGRFVFAVAHPCFNSTGCRKVIEEEDREGELITTYAVKVSAYIRPSTKKGLGIIGQPTPHYYFHRPISLVFNTFFQAGFVLDGIEESAFNRSENARRASSWSNYSEIPPVLAARMRLSMAM